MLEILQKKYKQMSDQIKTNLEANPEIFKHAYEQTSTRHVASATKSSGALATSLASARGIEASDIDQHYVNVKHRARLSHAAADTPPSPLAAAAMAAAAIGHNSNDDLFSKFNASLEASINKIYQSSNKILASFEILRRQNSALAGGQQFDMFGGGGVESYYLVPPTHKDGTDYENPSFQQLSQSTMTLASELSSSCAAHESNLRRQRDVLRNGLAKLKMDIRTRESRRTRELENEIERLVAENEKLKIANGRLKGRWDNLKESARKRRDSSNLVSEDEAEIATMAEQVDGQAD